MVFSKKNLLLLHQILNLNKRNGKEKASKAA